MIIIGVTSYARGGKDTFADYIADKYEFYKINMSDVLGIELVKKGVPDTKDNRSKLGVELREKYGEDIVMRMIIDNCQNHNKVVISGLRSVKEVELLKGIYDDFKLVAIEAKIDYRWKRRKDSDPQNLEGFIARDNRDIKHMGLDKVFEMACYRFQNESTLNEFYSNIDSFMDEILLFSQKA